MRVLGVNAVFHDSSAALVVDGEVVAAVEEERLSRRKHGKRPVPFAAWELPTLAMRACLEAGGLTPADLDAVAYGFDPALAKDAADLGLDDPWDHLRRTYAEHAPGFLASALPGLPRDRVRFVAHHVAHAASAGLAVGWDSCAVMVLDGRGESASSLLGAYREGRLAVESTQVLPHSLGLVYESLTEHLGFLRSSDEYKVMALASYGVPRFLDELRPLLTPTGDGGFVAVPPDWSRWAPPRDERDGWGGAHADLAASVQVRLEEVLVDLARWLRDRTGETRLALAGGIALNCVANSRIWREAGFDEVWAQPAAGDAGTALGAALTVAVEAGDAPRPMPGAALGRGWSDDEIAAELRRAKVPFRTGDVSAAAAEALARDEVVAWFDGRSEFGPRALGQRSLLAHPGFAENLERLNDVKGREQFRPVAPMVLLERAPDLFSGGPVPSPYMLFVHQVADAWRDRIPAAVHVDGTARIQTVDRTTHDRLARMLDRFEEVTGLPVVINTSLNTAGRPMVDSPHDALELFGSSPVDLLVLGGHTVRRADLFEATP